MYCYKCGRQVEDGKMLCDECAKKMEDDIRIEKEDKEAKKYLKSVLIFLIISYAAVPVSGLIDYVCSLLQIELSSSIVDIIDYILFFVARISLILVIVMIIVSKIKFPENKTVSTVFNIMVILLFFGFCLFSLFMYTCLTSCQGLG